jgi:hypothetical protein
MRVFVFLAPTLTSAFASAMADGAPAPGAPTPHRPRVARHVRIACAAGIACAIALLCSAGPRRRSAGYRPSMSRPFAIALATALLLAATSARAGEPLLLPRRETSTLDRALSLSPARPQPVPVMGRAGGTAMMIVGSVMIGGGWLVANGGLLVLSQADDAECPGGGDCGYTPTQSAAIGMMVGGAVVCMIGVPLMIYGSSVRQRETPRRGPSRWGTGGVQPQSPLSFRF